jgi:ribosomal protein S6--L-glutamate ligase
VKVCLLVDHPGHPVLEAAARELAEEHGAAVAIVEVSRTEPPGDADVYLLKARSERALRAARRAELAGASVINSVAATAACLDRVSMAQRMWQASLPFPDTQSAATLDCLIASLSRRKATWPIIVKSRRSRRGDLVRLVSSSAELHELASDWGSEAVVAQRFVRHDGSEQKVWVIGRRVYAARKRPELDERGDRTEMPMSRERLAERAEDLPEGVEDLARAAGAAFGLELYGVDVLLSEHGPVAVDVNPFPGFRRVPSAGDALADHVMRLMRLQEAPA